MEYMNQSISRLSIGRMNNTDDKHNKNDDSKFKDRELLYDYLSKKKGLFFITGRNGIGKSYLLDFFEEKFRVNGSCSFVKLKNVKSLEELKEIVKEKDRLILDGLDELDINVSKDIINYILSGIGSDKLVIVSSRRDYLYKESLIKPQYNIYEIEPLTYFAVKERLQEEKVDLSKVVSILDILNIPRYLEYVILHKDKINSMDNINKYDLLELIVNQNFSELENHGVKRIQKNVHIKVLQTLALTMIVSQKYKILLSDFTLFLSRIDYLDVKNYLMNDGVLESFLNNQLLETNNEFIQFAVKEIMEFLAAKEIIENNYSNEQLGKLVFNNDSTINNTKRKVDVSWFNVLSYVVSKSKIYRELIINHALNNLDDYNEYLDFLLCINFIPNDWKYLDEKLVLIIKKYTKLYQYLDNWESELILDNLLKLNVDETGKLLINELNSYDYRTKIGDYDVIYINNLFTCIEHIVSNISEETKIVLKDFLIANRTEIAKNTRIRVRYLYICFNVLNNGELLKVIKNTNIDNRIVSIILYYFNDFENYLGFDRYINNYIANCKENVFNGVYINFERVYDYISSYNVKRFSNLVKFIEKKEAVESFLYFFNHDDFSKLEGLFNDKEIIQLIFDRIFRKLYSEDINKKYEEIFFNYEKSINFFIRKFVDFEIIVPEFFSNINLVLNNFVNWSISEVTIKFLLNKGVNFELLYNNLSEKNILFNVWRLDLDEAVRLKYESDIASKYPEQLSEMKNRLDNMDNKSTERTDKEIQRILKSDDFFFKVDRLSDLIKSIESSTKSADVLSSKELKEFVACVYNEIEALNIDDILSKGKTKKDVWLYYFHYYPDILYILKYYSYDISALNKKSIILDSMHDSLILVYEDSDYDVYIDFLSNKVTFEYVDSYLNTIIDRLKYNYCDCLISLLICWLQKYKFDEFELNCIFSVISQNVQYIDNTSLNIIKKYNNKLCDDVLIYNNFKPAIDKRIDFIKNELVFEGDYIKVDENTGFEYSSQYYTTPLSACGIEYLDDFCDLIKFAFDKYNSGEYYRFLKYILDFIEKYVEHHRDNKNILKLIDVLYLELSKCKDSYFYNQISMISNKVNFNEKNIIDSITLINEINRYDMSRTFSYDDLIDYVADVLKNKVFYNLKKMRFFDVLKIKNQKMHILEETYQYIIGNELRLIMNTEGHNTNVIFEAQSNNKKRSDILLISEGFIDNIVLEVKLSDNSNDMAPSKIPVYMTKLKEYSDIYSSPKIIYVIVNQVYSEATLKKRENLILESNDGFLVPIFLDYKDIIDELNSDVPSKSRSVSNKKKES